MPIHASLFFFTHFYHSTLLIFVTALDAVVAGTLRRGREGARSSAGRCRQVPRQTQVPAAADHLGRRRDVLLLQGEVEDRSAPVVLTQPLPITTREERPGGTHWTDDDTSQQLVQEQTPERSRGRGQRLRVLIPFVGHTSL